MTHIGLESINGKQNPSLRLQQSLEPLTTPHMQCHQFLVAMHQVGHAPFSNGESLWHQPLMNFRHTAMLDKAPEANAGDHIQTKLPMRQRPPAFIFWTIGNVIERTDRVAAPANHKGEPTKASEGGDRAVDMVGHPHGPATVET